MTLGKNAFENIVAKRVNVGNAHELFSCANNVFYPRTISVIYYTIFNNVIYKCPKFDQFKICRLLTLYHTITTLYKKPFENIVGKGENADNQHFLLFPQCFFTLHKTNFNFSITLILSSASAFNFDRYKTLSFDKELKRKAVPHRYI